MVLFVSRTYLLLDIFIRHGVLHVLYRNVIKLYWTIYEDGSRAPDWWLYSCGLVALTHRTAGSAEAEYLHKVIFQHMFLFCKRVSRFATLFVKLLDYYL